MSSTDDAGDQIGEASVGALHTLVPAAEELDLVEELRADQYWRSLEVDRLYPDWVDLQDPVEPEPDTREALDGSGWWLPCPGGAQVRAAPGRDAASSGRGRSRGITGRDGPPSLVNSESGSGSTQQLAGTTWESRQRAL